MCQIHLGWFFFLPTLSQNTERCEALPASVNLRLGLQHRSTGRCIARPLLGVGSDSLGIRPGTQWTLNGGTWGPCKQLHGEIGWSNLAVCFDDVPVKHGFSMIFINSTQIEPERTLTTPELEDRFNHQITKLRGSSQVIRSIGG